MISVVKFTSEAEAQSLIDFVHNCLSGNESGWPALSGYSASSWANVSETKGFGVEEWAIDITSPAISLYRAQNPLIDEKIKGMFPGIAITQVASDYWKDPNASVEQAS